MKIEVGNLDPLQPSRVLYRWENLLSLANHLTIHMAKYEYYSQKKRDNIPSLNGLPGTSLKTYPYLRKLCVTKHFKGIEIRQFFPINLLKALYFNLSEPELATIIAGFASC